MKNDRHKEWLLQADYDLESAEILFKSGKYLHALFLCHLALEKSLKAVYEKKTGKPAPKIHNLNFLANEGGLDPDNKLDLFLSAMNTLNIVTRYPEELEHFVALYKREKTSTILNETRSFLEWIKEELKK